MSHSTPIAYSMTGWDLVVGGGILSPDRSLQFSESTAKFAGNGTAQFLVGVPLGRFGDVTFSHMFLSNLFDNAQNLHWTPPGQAGPVRFALGVQDITGQGGVSGETAGPRRFDPGESRTYYAVGTWQTSPDLYVSLGFGDTRFKGRVFGSASYGLGEKIKFVIEHDAFNWNTGLAFNIGDWGAGLRPGRTTQMTAMFGFVGGDHAYWSLNLAF